MVRGGGVKLREDVYECFYCGLIKILIIKKGVKDVK